MSPAGRGTPSCKPHSVCRRARGSRRGGDDIRPVDPAPACVQDVPVDPGRNAGDHRRAVRRVLLPYEPQDRHPVDVSQNLPPQPAPGPSSDAEYGFDPHPELAEDRDRVPKRERDTFHNRPDQVTSSMGQAETDEASPGARSMCGVRSPARYGRKTSPAETGSTLSASTVIRNVGVAADAPRRPYLRPAEGIAEPVQR